MWFNTFSGTEESPSFEITENGKPIDDKGRGYVFNPALEASIDVAIGLRRPLLVSGEPGIGKTELGYAIARRMRIPTVHFFSTKTTSEARDLFYTYDAIGRFRDVQIARLRTEAGDKVAAPEVGDYVEFQALGRAILDAHKGADVGHLLRGQRPYPHPGEPRRSVVIIDEIDKAPRDFPNDLLREIEDMSFRVPEFSRAHGVGEGRGDEDPETPPGALIGDAVRPIVVITSNEERQLPDAFLRRCIFHEIVFPDDDRLHEIIVNGLSKRLLPGDGQGNPDRLALPKEEADELLKLLRDFRGLQPDKKPGIAELIDAAALVALPSREPTGEPPISDRLKGVVPALAKLKRDRDVLGGLLGIAPSETGA